MASERQSIIEGIAELAAGQMGDDGEGAQQMVDRLTNDESASLGEFEPDSLDLVEVTMAVDDAFGINTEDEEVEGLENIGQYADLVLRKGGELTETGRQQIEQIKDKRQKNLQEESEDGS